VTRRVLAIDAGVAVLLAALVLILAPGVAVAGLIGLLVVVVCAISFLVGAWRRRSRAVRPARRPTRGR
jgi:F0F1-type ATP synthase assembly protein I